MEKGPLLLSRMNLYSRFHCSIAEIDRSKLELKSVAGLFSTIRA